MTRTLKQFQDYCNGGHVIQGKLDHYSKQVSLELTNYIEQAKIANLSFKENLKLLEADTKLLRKHAGIVHRIRSFMKHLMHPKGLRH